jgi:hypothetical protein
MKDENSPVTQKALNNNGNKHVPEDRKKVLQGLNAHWGPYESPDANKKENNNVTERGIKTSGNGMGGRKGTNSNWMFGGEDEENFKPKPKQGQAETKSFWDF